MVSKTGCLGLSLRGCAVAAAVITLLEAIVWTCFAAWVNLLYACTLRWSAFHGMTFVYVIYLYNPECPLELPEAVTVTDNPAAQRTHLLSIAYLAVSLLWAVSSLLFLVAMPASTRRTSARLIYPWIVVTAITLVLDLVATVLFGADAVRFVDRQALMDATGVDIGGLVSDPDIFFRLPSLILLLVASRGVFLWLLNGVLLALVACYIKSLTQPTLRESRFRDNPAQMSASAPPAAEHTAVHFAQPVATARPPSPPSPSPPSPPTPAAVTTSHGHGLAGAVPLPGLEAMAQARGGSASPRPLQDPRQLVRAGSQSPHAQAVPKSHTREHVHFGSASPPPPRDPRPPVRQGDWPERRVEREEGRAATKEEIVERLERLSRIRTSGRRAEVNPEFATEAKMVSLRRHGSSASTVVAEAGRDDPRRGELSPTRKFRDEGLFLGGGDPWSRPHREHRQDHRQEHRHEHRQEHRQEHHQDHRQEPLRHLPRTTSVELPWPSRQPRDSEDARPRPGHKVERANSHRVQGSERVVHHVRHDDLQELKKDLPWSYITGKPTI